MSTLAELHYEEKNVLTWLDRVCNENGLHYSMIGGTMLGAIRHKGFIPWDDDIDIFMSMSDFKHLKKIFQSEQYFLQTPETDIQMPFAMYKIRRNNSLMPEPEMESLKMHQGIWIDIFVYTNAGSTDFAKKMQEKLFLCLKSYRCRYLNRNIDPSRKLHKFLTQLPKGVQAWIDNCLLGLIRFFGSKKSDEYFALDVGKRCFYKKSYFEEQDRYQFEDQKFCGPRDYDGFLTYIYGKDYMTPNKWSHVPDCSMIQID